MKTWILAVSGGVDSVTMLHTMMQRPDHRYVIVHVDHGIRAESKEDEQFVRRLATHYGCLYESKRVELGPGASEETAREKRWAFLREMQQKYNATAIVTGHHGDDVVETMIINLMRGTGWRGLVSLREHESVRRPLLTMRKSDVTEYAQHHHLTWREDATNEDLSYLRNYVRRRIVPRMSDETFSQFMGMYEATRQLLPEIEREVAALVDQAEERYRLIMWPDEVAREVLRARLGPLTRREMDRALLFARTARPYKTHEVSGGGRLKTSANQLIVIRGDS